MIICAPPALFARSFSHLTVIDGSQQEKQVLASDTIRESANEIYTLHVGVYCCFR